MVRPPRCRSSTESNAWHLSALDCMHGQGGAWQVEGERGQPRRGAGTASGSVGWAGSHAQRPGSAQRAAPRCRGLEQPRPLPPMQRRLSSRAPCPDVKENARGAPCPRRAPPPPGCTPGAPLVHPCLPGAPLPPWCTPASLVHPCPPGAPLPPCPPGAPLVPPCPPGAPLPPWCTPAHVVHPCPPAHLVHPWCTLVPCPPGGSWLARSAASWQCCAPRA